MQRRVRMALLAASLVLSMSATAEERDRRGDAPARSDRAEGPPATMSRVVFRSELPGLDPNSRDAQPKKLWRAGERWGRIEHPRDPKTGAQPIVLVASPDAWFADAGRRTIEHFRDPGPTYRFRAPIVDPSPELPRSLEEFEFGRELAFMTAHGVTKQRKRSERGDEVDLYVAEVDGIRVIVSAEPGTSRVTNTVVAGGDKLLAAFEYLEYAEQVPTDAALFQPPPGYRKVVRTARKPMPGAGAPKSSKPPKSTKSTK